MITLSARGVLIAAALCRCFLFNGECAQGADLDSSANLRPIYTFEALPPDAGWQQSPVTGIVQTRDGYLWLGTYNGLVRFDGERFRVFLASDTPGLQNSRITSLYEDDHGVLWIGHETGDLTLRDADGFRAVKLKDFPPSWAIETIVSDQSNDLWLVNANGLFYRMRDGYTLDSPGGGSPSRKTWVSRDSNGLLWIAANGMIANLERGAMQPLNFGEAGSSPFYQRVCPSAKGGVWVLGNGRIRRWRAGRWVQETRECPGASRSVTVLSETRSGQLVVGTLDDGLYLIPEGGEPLHFSLTNGLPLGLSHDWVRCMCEDHEGNLWIGTGGGLDSLRARKASMLKCPGDWQGRAVLSFVTETNGSAWIGTEGAGLYHLETNHWTRYDESSGLLNLFIWSVLMRRNGDLLVGSWGGGLMVKNGDRFETPPELASLSAPVLALLEDRKSDVWVGTTIGLFRYSSNSLTLVAGSERLDRPDVRTIAEAPDGTIWFGMSGGGLGSLKEGRIRQFRKADGLASDFVQALCMEPDGALWIGTADNGMNRYRDGRFGAVTNLPSVAISHIVDDGDGNLWMGSNQGILRAAKDELNGCADGVLKSVRCLTFGKAEGLSTLTCSGGFRPGACQTSDGTIWFPMTRGLAVINPMHVTLNRVQPPVVIEEMWVDGKPVNLRPPRIGRHNEPEGAVLEIQPGHQRFEITYTALSFAAPKRVRFKRYLENLDKDWSEPLAQRSVEYSFLRPGDYVFHIKACNNDGVWNEKGDSLTFRVLPHFWQTWLFRGASSTAAGVGFGGMVLYVSRRRLRARLDRLERQQALERERTRIARDIHDDLGASLTRITMLGQSVRAELEHEPHLASDVDQISQTARELTSAMDEIVWAVNPKHDTLDSLFAYLGRFAQNFLSSAGIRCRLDEPTQLPLWALTAEIRHNVFLAFKESLNNVVKHAKATEVRVSLEVHPHQFILTIADNGKGFDWARLATQSPPTSEGARVFSGNGVINMQRRLEEIGGRCEWQTSPGEGTRVKMFVHIRS
jgi:signal transduction histidine kinase/ligand-binding sensor domain-containing protein